MTIPGRGDLSPRRRHGGFGRHRRRWPRVLLVLLVLAGLGAGGYYGWHHWRNNNNSSSSSLAPCPAPTATSTLPPLPPLRPVQVLNGNLKPGLAHRVARQLHRRFGIPTGRVGNAARFIRGQSVVRYPSRLGPDATQVAAAIVPPPRLVVDNSRRRVELDLGTRYRRVATRAERQRRVKQALVNAPASVSPSPSAPPSPCLSP